MSTQYIGLSAAALTALSLVPQLVKVWKDRDTGEISLLWLLTLCGGLALWTWYGFVLDDLPLILSSAFSLTVNSMLIILYFRFGNNRKKRT